jgi:aminoglycoside phosphotransferase (APT) family kinase protein
LAEDLPATAEAALIPEVLAAVPGCESGRLPLAVRSLPGGGHNDIRQVDTTTGRFVVRRRLPPVCRPGANARFELDCQRLAALHGLAPAVIAAADDASWMVMAHFAGNVWQETELCSTQGVHRLGERLSLVHALPVPSDWQQMDAGAIALQQARAIDPVRHNEAMRLALRAAQLSQVVQAGGAPRCISHGDLHHSNLIGELPMLIDWEYAQVAWPSYDIACLLTYYPRLLARKAELMAAAGLSRPEDAELLEPLQELFACLNRLWAMAHGLETG